jgi:outer membrane protein TolC
MIRSFSGNVRLRNLAFLFFLALCPLFLFAQESLSVDASLGASTVQQLTIEQAVEMAIENNLSLQVSSLDLAAKKRKSDYSWNRFIPEVSLSGTLAGLNKKPEPTSFGPISLPAANRWNLSGNLQVSLNLNFALFEGMNNLKLDYQAGLVTYDNAKKQLERDVRKAYNSILLLDSSIQLLRDNLVSAEQQVAMAQANYQSGLVPELTWLQAQVAMENLKPTILEMENNLSVMQSSFAFSLGLPFGTVMELAAIETPDYIDLNVEDLIMKASSVKPEIIALKQNIIVMQSLQKAQKLQAYTPTIALGWNIDPSFQGTFGEDSLFMKDGWKQSSGMFRVTLALNLNAYLPFTATGMALQELDDTVNTLNLSLAQLIRGTEIEVYQTVLQLQKSQTYMEALKLTEGLALRSYQQTELAYQSGLVEFLEVQSALLEYQKAQNAVVAESFNYLSGLIDLEYATGVPFGTLSGE